MIERFPRVGLIRGSRIDLTASPAGKTAQKVASKLALTFH
jgi:hypothetical protein